MTGDVVARFRKKVWPEPMSGCHLWSGTVCRQGYGRFRSGGPDTLAHRVSWVIANGAIPEGDGSHGTCVCHKCDNPSCVNPDHLFLGTHQDNMTDCGSKGRSRVPHISGESHACAKLTAAQVVEIRERYAAGGVTQRELAEAFRVGQAQISRVVNKRKWANV